MSVFKNRGKKDNSLKFSWQTNTETHSMDISSRQKMDCKQEKTHKLFSIFVHYNICSFDFSAVCWIWVIVDDFCNLYCCCLSQNRNMLLSLINLFIFQIFKPIPHHLFYNLEQEASNDQQNFSVPILYQQFWCICYVKYILAWMLIESSCRKYQTTYHHDGICSMSLQVGRLKELSVQFK